MRENVLKTNKVIQQYFLSQKILPILTIEELDSCNFLIDIFLENGIKVFEITLRTKVALEAINVMSKNKNFIVGVGTLMTDSNIQNAIDVGAKFGVSPGISEELFEGCEKSNFPLIPGVSTPSEIMVSYSRGYKILKFFPAKVLGGVEMLKALQGPFPDCYFFPTGGINQNNFKNYLSLSNVYGVAGSWMVPKNLINQKKWKRINEILKKSSLK